MAPARPGTASQSSCRPGQTTSWPYRTGVPEPRDTVLLAGSTPTALSQIHSTPRGRTEACVRTASEAFALPPATWENSG